MASATAKAKAAAKAAEKAEKKAAKKAAKEADKGKGKSNGPGVPAADAPGAQSAVLTAEDAALSAGADDVARAQKAAREARKLAQPKHLARAPVVADPRRSTSSAPSLDGPGPLMGPISPPASPGGSNIGARAPLTPY